MRTRVRVLAALAVFTAAGLRGAGSLAAQAQCDRPNTTRVQLTVHSAPPQFSTTHGWALGPEIATLAPGATVRVCEAMSVGFPGDKKDWVRIQFTAGGNSSEGWIYAERTLISAVVGLGRTGTPLFGPAVAYAQGPEGPADNGLPSQPGPWLFYGWAFLAICLGMAAKCTFDWLQQGRTFVMQDYLLRILPPLLVSPMVFLSLSQLADVQFDAEGHGFMVSLCTAFQSGFFWQTVLAPAKAPAPQPDHDKRSGPALVPVGPSTVLS